MKNIAVIGSGTMGNGIAHTFAQFGYNVGLIDISEKALEKGISTISKNLDRQVSKGTLTEEEKSATLGRIKGFTSIKEGVENVELVVEAATENVELKLQIFRDIDLFANENTILATNTSSISITKIAAVTNRPEKVIGMHFTKLRKMPIQK